MRPDADTFEALHAGLTVELIQTPREKLVTCGLREAVADVLDENRRRDETYDYLLVEDGDEIIGLFHTSLPAANPPVDGVIVQCHMDRLSSANLIGGDGDTSLAPY